MFKKATVSLQGSINVPDPAIYSPGVRPWRRWWPPLPMTLLYALQDSCPADLRAMIQKARWSVWQATRLSRGQPRMESRLLPLPCQ
jgi:hypothetical protein